MSALAVAVVLAASPWSSPRAIVFGEGESWVIVDATTKAIERLRLPAARPADVSVSADGRVFAFVADAPGPDGRALFVWHRTSGSAPIRISHELGFVGEPHLSADGSELYYSGNVEGGGPGAHSGKSYSQIFRAHAPDWQQEAVTSGRGCHFSPVPTSRGWVWIHTFCMGEKWLELASPGGPEKRLPPPVGDYRELAVSPDGKRLLVASHGMTSVKLDETAVGEWRLKPRHERTRSGPIARPAWGANAGELLFQDDGWVWVHDARGERRLVSIEGEK